MKYRKLGSTELKTSVIGIGGGAFKSTEVSSEDIKKIIEEASKLGINLIETAEDYDEEKLGHALESFRNEFIIATKSLMRDGKHIEKSVENSLKKLNVEYIDIYQLHNVVSLNDLEERLRCVLPVLKKFRDDGVIRYIGITSDFVNPLMKAVKTDEFDIVEAHYNVGNTLSEKLFEEAKERGMGVIVAKPLGGGALVERKSENRKRNSEIMNISNALKFVLSNKNVSTALVGVKNPEHLRECALITKSDLDISPQERRNIEKRMVDFLGKNFCRDCMNCMPCDINGWNLNIPEILRLHAFGFIYGHTADLVNGYEKLELKIDACTSCKECEKRCPFNLPITKMLKEIDRTFEKYKSFHDLTSKTDIMIDDISNRIRQKERGNFDKFLFEDILKLIKSVEKFEHDSLVDENLRKKINDVRVFETNVKRIDDIREKDSQMYGLLDKVAKLYLQLKDSVL